MINGNSKGTININMDGRKLSIIVFSLFSSWMLSLPFQGQILYALIKQHNLNSELMIFGSIATGFLGLVLCGFFIVSVKVAKRWMMICLVFSIVASGIYFFPPSLWWVVSILTSGFMAGTFVGAWGFFYKEFTPKKQRIKTAADVLIYSNILMIFIDLISYYFSPELGLGLAIVLLGIAFFFGLFLPDHSEIKDLGLSKQTENSLNIIKPLIFLCLFIILITINSGLMYQVFNPAYSHLEWLTTWYWAIPYVVALLIMRNLPPKTNRNYILYIAIAMIGFSFISFMNTSHTFGNYLLVNTLMLGACGIFDLFWWSILGEMLEFHDNPAKIFGVGLSANVLGVLLGSLIGRYIGSSEIQSANLVMLALAVVLVSFVILPPLHKSLFSLLEDHAYLKSFYDRPEDLRDQEIKKKIRFENLSERESQVAALLIQRKTYKMIAQELFISENTVKYYVKNIYSKYQVQSRAELIETIVKLID